MNVIEKIKFKVLKSINTDLRMEIYELQREIEQLYQDMDKLQDKIDKMKESQK